MFKHAFGLALMLCLSGASSVLSAQSLGRIDFPTSGKPAAQAHFVKGVLLLHSFEFDDAGDRDIANVPFEHGCRSLVSEDVLSTGTVSKPVTEAHVGLGSPGGLC